MRVLLLCDFQLKYVARLALALRGRGADVMLVCREHAREFGGDQAERRDLVSGLWEAGVRVVELPGRVSSPGALPTLARTLRRVRAWRPEIVHAQDNPDPRLFLLALGTPLVLTIHDPTPHPGDPARRSVDERVRGLYRRRATRVIVHGEILRAELRDCGIEDAAVIPHGLEPLAAHFAVPAERRIVFFGRLRRYKGLQTLVDAMRIVWQTRDDVRLVIRGEGPDADAIPSDPLIDFRRGYLPEQCVDDLLAQATLVVLPYTQASQSGVGALALARGIPVVVTDVGSLPDLALDETYVVRAGSSPDLAAALLRHLDHGDAVRASALAYAREHYSWDTVAVECLRLYASVAA
jgi:glycosyltransferase involved in cell wall biosynthesis